MSASTDVTAPESSYHRGLPVTDTSAGRPRIRRHSLGALLVVTYAVAAVVVAAGGDLVPMPRWLALHLLLLGAASNAVLVWSRHFAQALLHVRAGTERWATGRLVAFNAGAVCVLAGIAGGRTPVTWTGAALVVGAVAAHLTSLLRLALTHPLAGRLRAAVWFYVAAAASLVAGGTFGALMGTGTVSGTRAHLALHTAHVHVNLLGWVGLTILGTLFMLWPAVLRTRMVDTAPRTARRVLLVTVTGLVVAVAGAFAGSDAVTAAGVAGYAAGVVLSLDAFVRTARQRPPHTAAAWWLAAATGWFCVGLVLDVVGLARGGRHATDSLESLVPVLAVGLVAQALVGALTFLLPVTVGGGPAGNRRLTRILEAAWVPRLAVADLGVLVVALPTSGAVRTAGWAAALAGLGSFAVLVLAAVAPRSWLRLDTAVAGASLLAAVVALPLAVTGTWPGDGHHGAPAVAATDGRATVTLQEFSVTPGAISVPAGTRLVLTVVNAGQMTHDLKLDGRTGTRMLAPGERQTVDLGVISRDRTAWCTVPGHLQAGMVLDIRATQPGAGGETSAHGAHDGMAMPMSTTRAPAGATGADDPPAYDATLPPVGRGVVHHVTLHAAPRTVEIAPGVRQQLWTFGGSVPGPVLHGRVGDVFVVRLVNDADVPHSLDFHAEQVAPDVGMRPVPPGGSRVYRFRADHAGAWLYHCGVEPMLQHVAMGMYGAVVIDPPSLPRARSFVLVQSELYRGPDGGIPSMSRLLAADPDYVVFNGRAEQYVDSPLRARAGERVRLWAVDAGPSLPSALHVVGAQFDTVFKEGAYLLRPGNRARGAASQLDLQPGEGGFVELTLPGPGRYPVVTHRLADAARGAMGALVAR